MSEYTYIKIGEQILLGDEFLRSKGNWVKFDGALLTNMQKDKLIRCIGDKPVRRKIVKEPNSVLNQMLVCENAHPKVIFKYNIKDGYICPVCAVKAIDKPVKVFIRTVKEFAEMTIVSNKWSEL